MPDFTIERPATAQDLLQLHPSVTVRRNRLGIIEARRDSIGPMKSDGYELIIDLMLSQPDAAGQRNLAIVGDTRLPVYDDWTKVNIPPSADGLVRMTIENRKTRPGRMLLLARQAAELLVAHAQLDPDEQSEWKYIGYESARIYDEVRPAEDSLEVLRQAGREYGEADLAVDALAVAKLVFEL